MEEGYCSEDQDWFIAMRACIHKLLVGINYWGSKLTDAILVESFNMTLKKFPYVPQEIDSR